jgi:hypothetical protein
MLCGISRGSGRWWGHVSRSHLRSQSRSSDLVNMFSRHLVTIFPTYLVIAILRLLWNEGSEWVGNRVWGLGRHFLRVALDPETSWLVAKTAAMAPSNVELNMFFL